jgi:hypothetical protein
MAVQTRYDVAATSLNFITATAGQASLLDNHRTGAASRVHGTPVSSELIQKMPEHQTPSEK